MSRLQASSISWSSFSACRNSRGLPTETARVKRSERLSESAERVLSGRIHQIRIQGDCPAGKPRSRDAGGAQNSEAAHLNSRESPRVANFYVAFGTLLEFNLIERTFGQGIPTFAELGPSIHHDHHPSRKLS
jgi:hypothetical protein